ncbi:MULTISPECIES: sensor histidine kinase [unclassified Duganella]|uniref:sensor histidine kinase n=1 Tax=unclassified Duganella TaxID=2636909 RepID=UPI000E353D84|nr:MULTISPECIES: hypothetical protein [unclassified Duganella]RFP14608.1 hypothetical protein D0T23_11410 [Duganella sp. BJB475]RFP30956.1 hypothetical protein D0T21_13790 [Duganella sp. BJB476]
MRELVDSGSPQASAVLGSLIAYLELMHMRMPDRLQFTLSADDAALPLQCPPTTLLTLVENAIRHGIDPSEEGGRIDLSVRLRDGRCHAQVIDTGIGLQAAGSGLFFARTAAAGVWRRRGLAPVRGAAARRVRRAGLADAGGPAMTVRAPPR